MRQIRFVASIVAVAFLAPGPGVCRVLRAGFGPGAEFVSIQEAVDAAVSGDTIEVEDGTYPEQVTILGKNLTLRSRAGLGDLLPVTIAPTHLVANGLTPEGIAVSAAILIMDADVTLHGLNVSGSALDNPDDADILAGIAFVGSGASGKCQFVYFWGSPFAKSTPIGEPERSPCGEQIYEGWYRSGTGILAYRSGPVSVESFRPAGVVALASICSESLRVGGYWPQLFGRRIGVHIVGSGAVLDQAEIIGPSTLVPSWGVLIHGDGNVVRTSMFRSLAIGVELFGNDNSVFSNKFESSVTSPVLDHGDNDVR